MDENQEVTPNELDDVILPDDFTFEEENEEIETQETEEVETETTPEVEGKETEAVSVELDYKPLLEELSKKVKHLDDDVKFDSIDEIIANVQKGLDYDRKSQKLEELKNSEEMNYLKEKAEANGMEVKDFIKYLKTEEQKQEQLKEEERLNEMILNGVPEDVAKEVIETAKIRKELEAEKFKIKKQQEEMSKEEKKKQDMLDFVNRFPSVKVDDIPKEVFIEAEKSSLKSAYTDFLLNQREKELNELKQVQKNKESSPNTGVTEYSIENTKKDPLFEGFDSVE